MDQGKVSDENKLLAALGYPIGIIALVVLLTDMKQNKFMRYHAVQALGFIVAGLILLIGLGIVFSIIIAVAPFLFPLAFLTPLVSLAWLVLSFFYAYRAYQGKMFAIPIVSTYTKKYAGE